MQLATNPDASSTTTDGTEARCRSLECELQRAQQLATLGQLAAGVAHEINTPMQYIGDNTAFLQATLKRLLDLSGSFERLVQSCRAGTPTVPELERYAQEIGKSRLAFLREQAPLAIEQCNSGIDQVRAIVQALKEFSHPGGDELTPMDLNHLVRTATTVTRNCWRYQAKLELDLLDDLPPVQGNPQAFGQVLINLIVNASDAIESRYGQGSDGPPGTIVIRSCVRQQLVELQIQDDGTGIPESIQQRVMEPFFTTKAVGKGTGQGLALAYATIVEGHAGNFFFTSEVGQGTTFFIQIPRLQVDA